MIDIVVAWETVKLWLADRLHLSQPALHAIAGIALYLLFAWAMRRPRGSLVPLIPVALIEAANEASDFLRYFLSDWPWTVHATLGDIAATLVPPLVLALAMRRRTAPSPAGTDIVP